MSSTMINSPDSISNNSCLNERHFFFFFYIIKYIFKKAKPDTVSFAQKNAHSYIRSSTSVSVIHRRMIFHESDIPPPPAFP